MIKNFVASVDWGMVNLWALVVFFALLLIYLGLCFYSSGKEREKVELMQEISDALPWADPGKIIMDTEYAPVFFEERRKKY